MNLILYKYFGERKKVDKSAELVFILSTTGQFKADTSILNPSLLLSLPFEGVSYLTDENGNLIADVVASSGSDAEVLNFNYFYIEEFRRFYYVSSIVVSSNNLLIVSGEVDPLYSFKDQILQNKAMIERNEFDYSELQEDSLIPLELEKSVEESTPLAGELVNTQFKANHDLDDSPQPYLFTLSIASIGNIESVIQGLGDLPTIATGQAGDIGGQAVMTLTRDNVLAIVGDLMGDYSALSTFFKSLVAYPYELDERIDTPLPVQVYKYEETRDPATGQLVTAFVPYQTSAQGCFIPSISKYRVLADFTLPLATSYVDMNPYSHYEIYLPFYGWHELNYNEIAGDRLTVYYSVNYENGSGEVYLYDYTDQRLLFSATVQIGIALSLSSSNAQELQAQKNAAQLNLILGLVGSGIGVLGSAARGNVLGAVGSGLSAVQSVTSYINQTSLMFQRAQSTHNGPAGALYAPLEVKLRKTKAVMRTGLNLADFAHQYGRPLRDIRTLSTLSGYTKISQIHLDNCDATAAEKDLIESSLIAGVIL